MRDEPIEIRPHDMIAESVSSSDSGADQGNDWDDTDNGRKHLAQDARAANAELGRTGHFI